MGQKKDNDLAKNRRAYHDYEIIEDFEAGIVLVGCEVKSLRNHGGSLVDAYVTFKKSEPFLINASIAPYSHGNIYNKEERRDRKLLLHKRESVKLRRALQEKGLAIVPLSLYLKKGRIKVKIGLGRGKKHYDKREALKTKEDKRRIEREIKRAT
ncbi:MAG: SsrA-binding protein SmpB [Simkaniaceae bacterium]